MNQILFYKKNDDQNLSQSKSKKRKITTFFKFQFAICSIIVVCISSYYAYSSYEKNKKEQISQKLKNNFNITTLYSNTVDYSTLNTSTREYVYN